jgi:hypothetical protein
MASPGERLSKSRLVVCVQYSTKAFKENRWAIRYYAPIQGHELVARRDLIPSEPDHPRAGNWYYALQLGPLEHKLPPIVANRRRGSGPDRGPRFRAEVESDACVRMIQTRRSAT